MSASEQITDTPEGICSTDTLPPMPKTISNKARAALLAWKEPEVWRRLMTEDEAAIFPDGTLLANAKDEGKDMRRFALSPYGLAMREALLEKLNVRP